MSETPAEDSKMPLLDHLTELRTRLLWCVGSFVVLFIICVPLAPTFYIFLMDPLYEVMKDKPGARMIFTGLPEQFLTEIKIAFFCIPRCFNTCSVVADLEIRGARSVPAGEKRLHAVFGRNAGPVHHGGGSCLLFYHSHGVAVFPQFRNAKRPRDHGHSARTQGQRVPVTRSPVDVRVRYRV